MDDQPQTVQDWLDIIHSINHNTVSVDEFTQMISDIDDQEILFQLGLRLSEPDLMRLILTKTTIPTLLDLFQNRNNPEIRELIVEFIKDDQVRLHLFKQESNPELRIQLITPLLSQLAEDNELVKLIERENSHLIRALLISYLDPEEHHDYLVSIVFGDEFVEPRQAAAELIADDKVIKTILDKEQNGEVRYAAMKDLDDISVLQKLADNDLYWKVRKVAIEKLNDPDLYSKAAASDPSMEIRLFSIEKIEDPNLLASIAMNDPNPDLRIRAVELLIETGDQMTLYNIALEDTVSRIKILAISQIDNQQILSQVMTNASSSEVKLAVIARLTDIDILIDFMRRFTNLKLQRAIVERLAELREIISLELLEAENTGSLRELIQTHLKVFYDQ